LPIDNRTGQTRPDKQTDRQRIRHLLMQLVGGWRETPTLSYPTCSPHLDPGSCLPFFCRNLTFKARCRVQVSLTVLQAAFAVESMSKCAYLLSSPFFSSLLCCCCSRGKGLAETGSNQPRGQTTDRPDRLSMRGEMNSDAQNRSVLATCVQACLAG
jgi:hypothetical protein